MKYYAVIDTNVIVSSMLKAPSNPAAVVNLIKENVIVPLLNSEIIDEYKNVLLRNEFGFSEEVVEKIINEIIIRSIKLDRKSVIEEFKDKTDIVFYEIVMSVRCTMDAYLVTGNIKHYPIRNYVVTPRQMLDIIEQEKESEKKNNNESA